MWSARISRPDSEENQLENVGVDQYDTLGSELIGNPTRPQNKGGYKLMKTKTISTTEFARKGGNASFKKLGKKGMSAIGKKGAEARWGKKLKTK